jgi:hypothetical protein
MKRGLPPMPDSPLQISSNAAAQTPHARKQQIITQGAICRAQILNSSNAIRHGADIKVIADQAKHAAVELLKDKFYRQQKNVQKLMPVLLERALTVSSVSTRTIRKPVLYGAMILGAISAFPRLFKERKSHDSQ